MSLELAWDSEFYEFIKNKNFKELKRPNNCPLFRKPARKTSRWCCGERNEQNCNIHNCSVYKRTLEAFMELKL